MLACRRNGESLLLNVLFLRLDRRNRTDLLDLNETILRRATMRALCESLVTFDEVVIIQCICEGVSFNLDLIKSVQMEGCQWRMSMI